MYKMNGNNESSRSNIRTLGTLTGHLREVANILRGPVDAADFKNYIFTLLFFKRISDVYDDVHQSTLESYLRHAATLMRGYIHAGDYKQFIL